MNKGVSSVYQETNLPADTINSVQITTNNTLFCTTSWDGDVRCYGLNYSGNAIESALKSTINIGVPATSCCWTPDNSQIIIGSADGKVYLWNVTSGSNQPQQISQHNHAIIGTVYNQAANCLIEGSIDGDMRAYDIRSPNQCMNLHPFNCMTAMCTSVTNTNLALSSGTDTLQFNLSNTSQPFDVTKESGGDVVTSLCYSPTKYFAAGMSNGLVHIKFFNPQDSKDGKDLRFRVGRKDGYQYSCSCLTSHNPTENFVTAADDESVILWNIRERTKMSVYEQGSRTNPYSITACTYSQDGNILIYAKGYNWIFVEGYPGTIKSSAYKCHFDNKLIVRLHQVTGK